MKAILIVALMLLTSCASLNTYNAKAWKPNKTGDSVIFENDQGLAVLQSDGWLVPYTYQGTNPDDWYRYNFKTQGVDEREAKALKWLGVSLAGDVITSQIGFSRGCVEKNVLAKGIGPVGMAAYSLGNFGLFYITSYSSSIYQSTLKHDTRVLYAGAAFKGYFALKNTLTKC
jgi:hypothetical protein